MTPEPRPVKVLLVAPSLDAVGGQSVQADLILRRLRDEPALEMSFQPINPRLPAVLGPLRRVRYARTVPSFTLYCAQLFAAMRRCDVVHVFSASYFSFLLASTPALRFARFLRKPVILNYHSGEAEDHLARWPSAVRALRLANSIVVPSTYLVEVFRRFGFEAQAVRNAVDLGAFRFRARPGAAPAFLVNRSFEGLYNIPCVLRAFASIQKRRPDARLTVAGDGPARQELRQLASDLALRNTRFVGRVAPQRMPALYDDHDVWLNASEVDNMPLSILEAYACGLAVVSTNPGGIPHMVHDGLTGRLVSCGDAEALAAAALEIIANPALFSMLTRNARDECAGYDWDVVKQGWMAAYARFAPEGSAVYARST
jgi:glycosyltransferase involved in cell wall biosynthesis